MTNYEAIVQFLWTLVSREVAVRGGPTVFGYGNADSHVMINHTDARFAVENLDFDPDTYDDGSKRLKSAGKVRRLGGFDTRIIFYFFLIILVSAKCVLS